ncbi:Hydroxycinnamoyl-Coenzyme A shikimate/quinate hydroxycinnamoyltransferase [Morus notabilis]|uniref:Hydroxycinnamoyl-Coenzyme A shikimate/quinate hydroxycinnamoyltransferase n=2 Tax=Morus notabilis TaxID=981085 RepID=W9QTZ5_9ROSA|nr:Hydroxycinnamoyl-Coenzyme A shikimate/quinate hydroxycinnamoyltransferase [Morus notabilis]
MVKPAEKTPRRSLRLSVLDWINNHPVHNSVVQFYRSIIAGAPDFFDADMLKKTLSKVLVPFYPVAGRYGVGDDGRIEINCNEEGVLFVEAESGSTIDDFGDFAPSPDLKKLVPAVDYSGGLSSYPLMVVQITYFKCGGVSLGSAMEHHTVDGTSAMHLMNSWSQIARGLDITIPPFLDRSLLDPRNPPQPKFNHIEYQPTNSNKIISLQNHSTITSIFKLTKDQLSTMKSLANKNGQGGVHYSTFEVLAGHTWKCVCKARDVPRDEETRLYFPVNGRPSTRFQPQLPLGFFGNAIFAGTAIALAGDLQTKPLSYAVSLIHETLVKMNNDYLRSAIDHIELQPDISPIRLGARLYQSPNFGITSWSRMGTHDADFGWGRPCYMGIAAISFEGKSYIVPSAADDGGFSLIIALHDEHMKVFEKSFYEYM